MATAITTGWDSAERDAQWLHALASRLREADPPLGLENEADLLDAIAHRFLAIVESISRHADELLAETDRIDTEDGDPNG